MTTSSGLKKSFRLTGLLIVMTILEDPLIAGGVGDKEWWWIMEFVVKC